MDKGTYKEEKDHEIISVAPGYTTGQYGTVGISPEKITPKNHLQRGVSYQTISSLLRFSYDRELLAEVDLISTLYESGEMIRTCCVHTKIITDELTWNTRLILKDREGCYFFEGVLGVLQTSTAVSISRHMYIQVLDMITKISDPDLDYGNQYNSYMIDDIIEVLCECDDAIMKEFIDNWDKLIKKKRKAYSRTL